MRLVNSFIDALVKKDHLPRGAWFPVLEFEYNTGTDGIGRHYRTPDNREMGALFDDYMAIVRSGLPENRNYAGKHTSRRVLLKLRGNLEDRLIKTYQRNLLRELIRLNPELAAVRFDPTNKDHVYHFTVGVLSGFNADDIDYFLNGSPKAPDTIAVFKYAQTGEWPDHIPRKLHDNTTESFDYRLYLTSLGAKLGGPLGWIPSPATVQKIKQRTGLSDWEPSADEWYDAIRHTVFNVYMIPETECRELWPDFKPRSLKSFQGHRQNPAGDPRPNWDAIAPREPL